MEYIKIPPITDMAEAFSVKGYNVIVTGGNRGLGFGIATAFAQAGANVAIVCRGKESGAAAAKKLEQYGGKYINVAADVSDEAQAKAAAEEIYAQFGTVDVLINNAGVDSPAQFFDEDGLSEFRRVIDVDLIGPANMIYAVAPGMMKAGRGGAIVNISSAAAVTVHSAKELGGSGYCSAKAGLDQFTRHLAIILGDYGIRVNGINPGPTHSDLDEHLPDDFRNMVENELPAHRFGEPIEIGALCVFLSCPASAQIRGINCRHDGGLTLIQ
jgi:NAD(P)-dependent dehydrogenase (short-subunit alcohol dehydrogenase family)